MPSSFKFCYGLLFPFFAAFTSQALANDLSNDQTFIADIRCGNLGISACADLVKRLDLKENHIYSSEDLDSINVKLQALDTFRTAQIQLLPASTKGKADLEISVVEKSSVRHSISLAGAIVHNEIPPNDRLAGASYGVPDKRGEVYAGYSVSDHDFLGRGIFYQISLNLTDQDTEYKRFAEDKEFVSDLIGNYNVELVQNITGSWFWTARAVGIRTGLFRDDFGLLGVGYQISPNSSFTIYEGTKRDDGGAGYRNVWGINYSYSSQDNGLIPTRGYLVSVTTFERQASSNLNGYDLRGHWRLGDWFDRQGVLTLSLQGNSPLNPAIRNNSEPVTSAAYPESSITYSLINARGDQDRSSLSVGASYVRDRERKSLNFAYKAATSNFDLSLGFMLVHEKGVRDEISRDVNSGWGGIANDFGVDQ